MRLWIEIDYEIDGEATRKQIVRAAYALIGSSIVTSEYMGDDEGYALIVKSLKVLMEPQT